MITHWSGMTACHSLSLSLLVMPFLTIYATCLFDSSVSKDSPVNLWKVTNRK